MTLLPQVRKRFLRRRTEKILESEQPKAIDIIDEKCLDASVESFISVKLDYFFKKLGTHEARGLYDVLITQVEKPMIEKALLWANGNQLKAARVLGINRNTLRQKIRRLKIKI